MAITIIKQPVSRTLVVGETIVFTVVAEGDGLTYQWEYSTNGGEKWDNNTLNGNATDTLSFVVRGYHNGYLYRCKITDSAGEVVRSNVATLNTVAVMPDRGLIAYDTLTAIADAIRAKTETTDRVIPDDMAALIEGIKGGVPGVSGTVTASKVSSINLGVTFPSADNYIFMMRNTNNPATDSGYYMDFVVEVKVAGTRKDYKMMVKKSSSFSTETTPNSYFAFDTTTGVFTPGRYSGTYLVYLNGTYDWIYVTW